MEHHEAITPRQVPEDVPFVRGSILDTELVAAALRRHGVTGVMHIAGFKYAGVSVERPLHTYDQNVTGTISVLRAMQQAEVPSIVFSSSAAVYGTPDTDLVTEETPTTPESPYGESKLIGEWLLRDQQRAVGLRHTSLRYFNVVGSGTDEVYDSSPHNLFPLVIEALLEQRTPRINGDDYPTPDGTCVRDYIHVDDLCAAHLVAMEALEPGRLEAYNLGIGRGYSVREVFDAAETVVGRKIPVDAGPRRPGDPAVLYADSTKIQRALGWSPRYTDIESIIATAWSWFQAHPNGYGN